MRPIITRPGTTSGIGHVIDGRDSGVIAAMEAVGLASSEGVRPPDRRSAGR